MQPQSRRRFLGLTVAGGAAALAACTSGTPEPVGAPTTGPEGPGGPPPSTADRAGGTTGPAVDARARVVVVGAGLAGLTAALDLRAAGWDVVVLEARDRLGGRVRTLHAPFADGVRVEAGGELVDGDHEALRALLGRFGVGLERRSTAGEEVVRYEGRLTTVEGLRARRSGAVGRQVDAVAEAVAALGDGLDPEHPDRFDRAEELDAQSLDDLLARQRLSPEADFLVRSDVRSEYAAEPGDLSLLFLAQQAQVGSDEDRAETHRIAGGGEALLTAIGRALGDAVRLSSPVIQIGRSPEGVEVVTATDRIAAAQLVLALPVPPLRRIRFDPPLPEAAARMVAELGMGSVTKVITEHDGHPWRAAGHSGATAADLPYGTSWDPTDSYDAPRGALTRYVAGAEGRRAAPLDEPTRISRYAPGLDEVLPEIARTGTGAAVAISWDAEPESGGAYAAPAPGQVVPFWPVLRAPIGPIRFAGEHTEALAGYMESAVRSGHRVAREIGPPPG